MSSAVRTLLSRHRRALQRREAARLLLWASGGLPWLVLLLGLLGGFTTFSTFGYETLALARDTENLKALANIALHVTAGLGAVWFGGAISRIL